MKKKELIALLTALADDTKERMDMADSTNEYFKRGQQYARWTTLNQVIRIIVDEEYATAIARQLEEEKKYG